MLRVVSIVPSLTETICSLGKRENIVGCTQFCVRPADLHRSAVLVGGTKDPNLSMISDLTPDLIVVNSEENRPEDIAACRKIADVLETFPKGPSDVPAMLRSLGQVLDAGEVASAMAERIEARIQEVSSSKPGGGAQFAYFIWKNPYMVASKDTYISRCLELAGFQNVVSLSDRYPSVTLFELDRLKPELIFLSSEPYPFRQRDVSDIADALSTAQRIMRIDGQLVSWFGHLTLELLDQLARWPSCEPKFVKDFLRA